MENKLKIILAATLAILLAGTAFFLWRATHAPQRKIVVQKHASVKEPARKRALPGIQKKFPNPRIAIVMDDFGYNMSDLDTLFSIRQPVTFSVLPNLPYSRRVAELARSKGCEVILHLPLESNNSSAAVESDTIKTNMTSKEIISMLDQEISSVPGLRGVSNHQGSKATENKATMAVILEDLKRRKLYYFDSLVTDRSVCKEIANNIGVPYAKRDMFLDNTSSEDYIEKQILSLRRLAFRKGSAVAVCHDRKNTIAVLGRMMPELSAEGIEFVSLSDMVK